MQLLHYAMYHHMCWHMIRIGMCGQRGANEYLASLISGYGAVGDKFSVNDELISHAELHGNKVTPQSMQLNAVSPTHAIKHP